MPIYEFHCLSCEEEFEELMPAGSNGAVPICPECGSKEVEKRLSVFAFSSGTSFQSASEDGFNCPLGDNCSCRE